MVFPYMDHDLCGLLSNSDFVPSHSMSKLFMRQILQGMDYIHAVSSFLTPHEKSRSLTSRTTLFTVISRLRIFWWTAEEKSRLPILVWLELGPMTN